RTRETGPYAHGVSGPQRTQSAARPGDARIPRPEPGPGRATRRARFVCRVGTVGIHGSRGRKGSRAGGCDGFFPARRTSRSGSAAADQAGSLPARPLPLGDLFATDEEFSAEYGSGGHAYLYWRGAGPVGASGDAIA